jgi:hypothetical protein
MLYDRGATRAAVGQVELTARSRNFVASWFSAWRGNRLPSAAGFSPDRLQNLKSFVLICTVGPDTSAEIVFLGRELARVVGARLVGLDWFSLVPLQDWAERKQRIASVAEGALLRTVREVRLKGGKKYTFEALSVPLRPDDKSAVAVVTFFDWHAPDKRAVLANPTEIACNPILAEFVPIARTETMRGPQKSAQRELRSDERAKVVSQASVRFVIKFMREAMKAYSTVGLDPTDYLIVIAIDTQNVAHIHNDPNISLRYAGFIEPDWMRRGVSRAAISRITQIPLETARRRINQLIEKGILAKRRDGVIMPVANRIAVQSRIGKMRINAKLVEQLIEDLKVRDVVF